jgi:hypothetical protein
VLSENDVDEVEIDEDMDEERKTSRVHDPYFNDSDSRKRESSENTADSSDEFVLIIEEVVMFFFL